MKIYLEIYYLGCDNAAELQYNFFIFNTQHKFCTQIMHTIQWGQQHW